MTDSVQDDSVSLVPSADAALVSTRIADALASLVRAEIDAAANYAEAARALSTRLA